MPTEYFEAKITRAVKPKEFHTAVVPDTASAETIKYLKDQGINIKQYKRGDQADRARAIKEAAEENEESKDMSEADHVAQATWPFPEGGLDDQGAEVVAFVEPEQKTA